jgi:3-hydroxyisobutyrate dehydrogenase
VEVGFLGLGTMGQPMALNLARAGTALTVWNRSPERTHLLQAAGAKVARSPAELFDRCPTVVVMLADGPAVDSVLGRGAAAFSRTVADHTLIHMATTAPEYSERLEADVIAAGGRYVEAPVSGSRIPAETGQLIAMLAGDRGVVDTVEPLLAPMCQSMINCGQVPNALLMKLAVNLYLITMVAGLSEAFHFANNHRLDLTQFQSVLDAGPMASNVSRLKLSKLLAGDFEVQASVANVFYNNRLIAAEARRSQVASPLLDVCLALFGEAEQLGHGSRHGRGHTSLGASESQAPLRNSVTTPEPPDPVVDPGPP